MDCFICGAEAGDGPIVDDCRYMNCRECGEYMVSGSMEVRLKGVVSLDIQRTREWLQKHREEGGTPPVITTGQEGILS